MSAKHPRPIRSSSRKDARTVFAIGVWSAVTLIAAVLISRRLGGAFSSEAAGAVVCLSATVAFLLGLIAHALWSTAHSTAPFDSNRFNSNLIIAGALTLLPPLGIAAALWTVPSAVVGGYLTGLLFVSSLVVVVIGDLTSGRRTSDSIISPAAPAQSPSAAIPEIAPKTNAIAAMASEVSEPVDEEVAENEPMDEDPSVLQWMTRRQLPDGQEIVEGSVRIFFGPGERMAVAHVSFVPPMTGRPRTECHVLSDFDGRTRVAAAQTYGLRIEARRSDNAAVAAGIEVAFSAQVSASQAAAA